MHIIVALISQSAPAPFGQGSKTIYDRSVRNCRQIDPSKVTLSSHWDDVAVDRSTEMSVKLGVQNSKIAVKLYELGL